VRSGCAGLDPDRLFHGFVAWLVVVACGRLLGRAVTLVRQPPVIGEVLSGILLGPSLLGAIAPGTEAYLFPSSVRPVLASIAQTGVILYMFLVGLEFDGVLLRRRTLSIVAVSQAAVLAPFALGCALAALLPPSLVPATATRVSFVLFMGAAMSITAFPVLARILTDRGLTRTPLGIAALTCAAINDVMAWILLAVVVGVTRAMPTSGVPGELVIAFAAGAVIPSSGAFARTVTHWLGGAVAVLLLPAFFALTGLRTQLALVSSASDWLLCGAIVVTATAGKLGGAALAGRLSGQSWRFAAQLGALMNARGLMELIVLAVGLDAGIISPAIFTMMVIMAIATTAMTGPLLDSVSAGGEGDRQDREERADA
jgi:Kef-type K+ transport system membrane component KefB